MNGNALVGATVLVQNYSNGANASIYSDNGLTPISTSTVITGSDGQFSFFAADGDYNLVMSKNSTVFKTQSPVTLFDGAAQLTFADTGSANAYAISNSALEKALRTGLRASFQAANTNTGASTFSYNGLTAKPIVGTNAVALLASNIASGGIYQLEYDGTNWQLRGGAVSQSGTIGPNASGAGTSLTVNGATNWQAVTFTSTAQFIGGNKMTNANQSVTTTQILLHGLNAEFVSIAGAAGADQKCWSNYPDNSGNYNYRIENDALTATYTYDQIARTGNSGTFGSHQVIRTFNHGYGSVTFQSTVSNAYQVTINAGSVPGFANGLNIIAGSILSDNALLIQNQGQTTSFLQMTGQGATTLATVNSNGLITLTVKGLASNTSPVATFGGAASNFATITDGAGIVNQWGVSTGLAAAQVGASSNHALFLTTNNTARISIAASGAITFNSVATTTTAPGAGGAGALPATPKGYFSLTIGSYAAEVPYY